MNFVVETDSPRSAKAKDELDSLKKSFDDYMESSLALEKELEESLASANTRTAELEKLHSAAEEKCIYLHEKNIQLSRDVFQQQQREAATLERLQTIEEKNRNLESANDELLHKVRILEATEDDLNHKLERAEELVVFLKNDLDDLNVQHVERERLLKQELTEMQAELAKQYDTISRNQRSTSGDASDDDVLGSFALSDLGVQDESVSVLVEGDINNVGAMVEKLSSRSPFTPPHSPFATSINERLSSEAEGRGRQPLSISNAKRRALAVIAMGDADKIAQELLHQVDLLTQARANYAALLLRLQSVKNNIQVCCRFRPPTEQERTSGSSLNKISVRQVDDCDIACFDERLNSWRSFAFDRVWGFDALQSDVFADLEPLVVAVVDGVNTCLFAFGQTGSGKTYTMNGEGENLGVIYLTMSRIFELLELKKIRALKNISSAGVATPIGREHHRSSRTQEKYNDDASFSFTVDVSMLEIYNDQVFDLLDGLVGEGVGARVLSATNAVASVARNSALALEIKQGSDGSVYAAGLQKKRVYSMAEVSAVLEQGNSRRATGATNLNEHSSRSHLVVEVKVATFSGGVPYTVAKLHLVDLAGSERVDKSGVKGAALKEAQFINKSLSALGDVMEALDSKAKYIPYRNSKLTYLLQDSLGGDSRATMVVTVCPTLTYAEETIFALQFATRVRNVEKKMSDRGAAVSSSSLTTPGSGQKRGLKTVHLEEALKAAQAELKAEKAKVAELVEKVAAQDAAASLHDTPSSGRKPRAGAAGSRTANSLGKKSCRDTDKGMEKEMVAQRRLQDDRKSGSVTQMRPPEEGWRDEFTPSRNTNETRTKYNEEDSSHRLNAPFLSSPPPPAPAESAYICSPNSVFTPVTKGTSRAASQHSPGSAPSTTSPFISPTTSKFSSSRGSAVTQRTQSTSSLQSPSSSLLPSSSSALQSLSPRAPLPPVPGPIATTVVDFKGNFHLVISPNRITAISTRSKEALFKHQERMEKRRLLQQKR